MIVNYDKTGVTTMAGNIYDNRELSWLKFNQRVLQESLDTSVPLLERLTFTAIFQSNLDEFFMVRVGTLFDQLLTDPELRENKTNMTSREQLDSIFARVRKTEPQKDKAYRDIMKLLEKHDIKQVSMDRLTDEESAFLREYFRAEIQPVLSPLIIDKRHPLPFIKNKELYIAVRLDSKSGNKIGLLPVSERIKRVIQLNRRPFRFVLAEDVILKYASEVFENYNVLEKSIIRVTRNADISEDDDSLLDNDFDFRDVMEELIQKRKKLAPVRLQICGATGSEMVKYLCKRLEINENQVFSASAPLDLSFTFMIKSMFESSKPELCYPHFSPQHSPAISDNRPMAEQIRQKDIILHYPYESIKPFIRMLNEAAADPDVVSVKITLYRLARNSKIIQALVDMAERGKDVLVLVELRARFDEENNIGWSKRLQNAGCTIIYGPPGLKVHSKLLLITRRRGGKLEYITQVGTGNYNEKTSELYTDLSLLTANEKIAAGALEVFNALSLGSLVKKSDSLLVAPLCLQSKVLEMIDEEIMQARSGNKAYIGIKINSLSDRVIIEKLAEASQAGVKIELVIRGLCCLISGVRGKTDNIRVISIVGRFLEHSRIYIFGTKQRRKVYISSADFMTRNTVKRVEVAVPVYDPDIKDRVVRIFETLVSDDIKARIQGSDGMYRRKSVRKKNISAQDTFMTEATESAASALTDRKPDDDGGFSDFYKSFLMQ